MNSFREFTVLVVDDNRQIRTMLGAILANAGVGRVIYAADGLEALRILDEAVVDVAFVDQ